MRNKFLQLILISLYSASWELHQYSRRMCGPMKNPKVETHSQDSNSGPHNCKADALPHEHGILNRAISDTSVVLRETTITILDAINIVEESESGFP